MSADCPGTTTYAAGFGPRLGLSQKRDPYESPSRAKSPRTPNTPRMGSANSLSSSRGSIPVVDPTRLAHSLSEQYKLKKYRNGHADLIEADVEQFHREEEDKIYAARRRRDDYRDQLEEQIQLRTASREAERRRQVEAKQAITKDFDAYLQETLKQKNDQRERHQTYCRQIQQQHNELENTLTKRKTEDEAIAQLMVEDSHRQKKEEDERRAQKRALQLQLAEEMKREHKLRDQIRNENRQRQADDDKAYLAFVDAKAAHEEHARATHILSKQKVLATVTLPKIDEKKDTVPDYISMIAQEKRDHAIQRAQEQIKTRDALQRQMAEKSARVAEERERDRKAREIAEADARAFHEEQRSARQRQRDAAKDNENGIADQINQSIRRQYDINEQEWKNSSLSSTRNSPRRAVTPRK